MHRQVESLVINTVKASAEITIDVTQVLGKAADTRSGLGMHTGCTDSRSSNRPAAKNIG
jgi:hypothetical protein